MPQLLILAVPPLVGAVIGYTTNYLAIRMLFRPLRPWRFLGCRLPLTPGIIPAKREQLAANIGEMVGEHLLTGLDVQQALDEEQFQLELRRLIENRAADFLQNNLGPLTHLLPKTMAQGIDDYLLRQTTDLLIREVPGLVDSIDVNRIVARKVNSLDLLHLEELLLSIMREQFTYINLVGALLGFLIGCVNLLFFRLL